jgi:hypothetical protein
MRFESVLFFETKDIHEWCVVEVATGLMMKKSESPFSDSDAFIIFDQARTRGSDMNMRVDAVVGVTLGMSLTKDRLMQGAGRLRKLGSNQKIVIIVPDEVQIVLPATISVRDVLRWVIDNTAQIVGNGILEWSRHGFHHTTTLFNPDSSVLKEDWSLKNLYSGDQVKKPLTEQVSLFIERQGEGDQKQQQIIDSIVSHGSEYGGGINVVSSTTEVEQERQISIETFRSEEHQKEHMALHAAEDRYWDFSKLFRTSSGVCLQDAAKVIPHIPLSTKRLYFTSNFMRTVDEYLHSFKDHPIRFVDSLLVLWNGQAIALSDREADVFLEMLWENPSHSFGLINFCRLKEEEGNVKCTIPVGKAGDISLDVLAFLQVFNGMTSFGTGVEEKLLDTLNTPEILKYVLDVISLRGKMSYYNYSTLETIVRRLPIQIS